MFVQISANLIVLCVNVNIYVKSSRQWSVLLMWIFKDICMTIPSGSILITWDKCKIKVFNTYTAFVGWYLGRYLVSIAVNNNIKVATSPLNNIGLFSNHVKLSISIEQRIKFINFIELTTSQYIDEHTAIIWDTFRIWFCDF